MKININKDFHNSYKGFSILELIVIIFIIAVFFVTIMSLFANVKSKTLIVSCQNNLHQLSYAFNLYAESHSGRLPHKDRDSDSGPNHCWFDIIDSYIPTSNFHCVKQCPLWSGYKKFTTPDEHSIKMNGGLCPKDRLPETKENYKKHFWYWPRLWDIKNKSKTVLLIDGRMDSPYNTFTCTKTDKPYIDIANRHNKGANLLFIDSSISYIKPEKNSSGFIGWNSGSNFIWNPYK